MLDDRQVDLTRQIISDIQKYRNGIKNTKLKSIAREFEGKFNKIIKTSSNLNESNEVEKMEKLNRIMSKVSQGRDLTEKDKKMIKNAVDASKGEANTKAANKIFKKISAGKSLTSTERDKLSVILDAKYKSKEEMNEETISEMAQKHYDNVDWENDTPEEIADKYITNARDDGYEDKKIVSGLGGTFKKNTVKIDGKVTDAYADKVDQVKEIVKEKLGVKSSKKSEKKSSDKKKEDKKDLPPSKVKDAAKKAADVYNDMKEEIQQFAGLSESCGKSHGKKKKKKDDKEYMSADTEEYGMEKRDGSGPHGKGMGPGKGKGCSPAEIKKYQRMRKMKESLTKEELKKFNKLKNKLKENNYLDKRGIPVKQ